MTSLRTSAYVGGYHPNTLPQKFDILFMTVAAETFQFKDFQFVDVLSIVMEK